jgi:rfaE bifunctional protein kinase chain/domain
MNTVPDFSGLRVAVVGDLVADFYLYGEPTRLSREAPVLVLRHRREALGAGGAANAARNLAALGARVAVLGLVGRDRTGRELLERLEHDGIDVSDALARTDWQTPTKTRILGAEPGRTPQHVLRIDREPEQAPTDDARAALAGRLRARQGELDVVLGSDYGYGLLAGELAGTLRALAAAGVRTVLDPRRSFEAFAGLTAMTPNLGELALFARTGVEELGTTTALDAAARTLRQRCDLEYLLVTLGNRGMRLYSRGAEVPLEVAAAGREAVDVSGAGDTAAAAFALGLAAGLPGTDAMRLANAAAGLVVMEPGATACSLDRLRSALPSAPRVRGGLTRTS